MISNIKAIFHTERTLNFLVYVHLFELKKTIVKLLKSGQYFHFIYFISLFQSSASTTPLTE